MAKFASNDILKIMRKYKIANDDNVPRNVEELKKITPDEFSEIFSFKFLGNRYYVVVDGMGLLSTRCYVGNAAGFRPFGKPLLIFTKSTGRREMDIVRADDWRGRKSQCYNARTDPSAEFSEHSARCRADRGRGRAA